MAPGLLTDKIPIRVNLSEGPPLVTPEQLNGTYNHSNEFYNQTFDGYQVLEQSHRATRKIRIVTVGAGATGIALAHKFRENLKNFEHQIYEKYPDLGGTWLENRYPGCCCDIPSHSYQFSWEPNPNWSSFYSTSREIWQYLKDVAQKYDLEKFMKFRHAVKSAKWNEERGKWLLIIERLDPKEGEEAEFEDECDILVNATGVLSDWKWPDIPGREKYKGKLLHSARWDESYDCKEKNVALIGCGSSAIQILPHVQPQAKTVKTYIRSSTWITAGFGVAHTDAEGTNFDYTAEQREEMNKDTKLYDEYRFDIEREMNLRFRAAHIESEEQKQALVMMKALMKKRLGDNERITKVMIPNFPVGCRRATPGNGYLECLGKPNVEVITHSIVEFTEHGLRDASGQEHLFDAIICATGFDVSFRPFYPVIGKHGKDLRDEWAKEPRGYLAVAVPNYPNYFMCVGPGGPTAHGSYLPVAEWHGRYILKMIKKLQQEWIKSYDVKEEAVEDQWVQTHSLMKRMVWSGTCPSWFKNGKVHGPVLAVHPGSRLHWYETMAEPRYEDYNISYVKGNRFAFWGNGFSRVEIEGGDLAWYLKKPWCDVEQPDVYDLIAAT